MTVRQALAEGNALLQSDPRACSHDGWTAADVVGEIINPSLDSALLLAHVLGCDRYRLLAGLPDELSDQDMARFRDLLRIRLSGESIAYILGCREFYGRSFKVDRRVLVPRADTEVLVEAALQALDRLSGRYGSGCSCHDTCTGSGCVGISIAAERPLVHVSLSDVSAEALAVAAGNAATLLPGEISLYESDLLAEVPGRYHVITANPPYVCSPVSERIIANGSAEPSLALDGGYDGLDFYRRLVPQAYTRLFPEGYLLVEIGDEQGASVHSLFVAAGYRDVAILTDLARKDRVVLGKRA